MVIIGNSGIVGMTTSEEEEAIFGKGVFKGVISGKLKSVVIAARAGSTIIVEESVPVTAIKSAVEEAGGVGRIGIDSVEGPSLSSFCSNASEAGRTYSVSTIVAGTSTFDVAQCWIILLYTRSSMTESNVRGGVASSLSGTGTVGGVSAGPSAKSLNLASF